MALWEATLRRPSPCDLREMPIMSAAPVTDLVSVAGVPKDASAW